MMCGRSWEPITELNYVEYQTHPSLVRARTHLPHPTAVFGAASTPPGWAAAAAVGPT